MHTLLWRAPGDRRATSRTFDVNNRITYYRFPSGEVSRMVYPDLNTTVNPSYTVRGQLAGVGWPSGSTSYVYLLDGKVDYQARTNGVTTTYGYDGRGMISSLRHTAGDHDLARRDYWRDDRDRITAWKRGTDTTVNLMEDGRGDRFGYDAEGQLTAASYRAATPEQTPSGAFRTDSFVYDELGNRMGANRVANRGAVLTFSRRNNGLNQYLNWTPSAIYYDDNLGPPNWVPPGNGVMMAEGWITASYNALNQPMAIWSQAYGSNFLWFGFDPLGRCVKRWVGTVAGAPVGSPTYFYYDGWNLVQEGPNATTADRSYVHGGRVDEIVASRVSGVWYNHHYDGQGNCILLSTINGGLQEQYDYDAFGFPYFYTATGNSLAITSVHTRFLFTGREWLSDLRIYDYRNRQYQPELGRFLQPDPKEFGAGDYNLYRYCHNDPVNKTDPLGLDAQFQLMRDPYTAGTNPRLAAATMRIFENGRFKGAVRVNEHGFYPNRQGIPQGHYLVLPKRENGDFPKGTPAITSPSLRDKPGATTAGHAEGDVLMHGEGASPDSRACLTLNPAALKLATDVFNRNQNSSTLDVSNGPDLLQNREKAKLLLADWQRTRPSTGS